MLISGINKFSLLDYPGKTACVIFTLGCNMRCGYCHNKEFVLPELYKDKIGNLISETAFLNFLETRKGLLDGVSICGGEPTLQNDLYIFCKKVKSLGFLVKLDTNGRDPKILQKLIDEKLVDYIAMDVKHTLDKVPDLIGVSFDKQSYLQSIQVLINSDIHYEFRTTVIKGVHTHDDILNIMQLISGAKNYYLQNYRPGKTLEENFKGQNFHEDELKIFLEDSHKYIKNSGMRT